MGVISLSPADLSVAALLIIALALLSLPLQLGLSRQLLIAGIRTTLQLLLIGVVLKTIFDQVRVSWLLTVALVMLVVAGREIMGRQKRSFRGVWGFGLGTLSMLMTSFPITLLALMVIIDIRPWYDPQYAIPLMGMMLGNTMSGIALGLDRLTQTAWDQRRGIEARLMMGQTGSEAIENIRRESIRSGMIPIINAMNIVGLVSLPGMMTGQILSGTLPLEAVKYQILIMFLIAGGTGFGTICAVWAGARRLFDSRHRLRPDRLQNRGQ
ncbi:iron export ABC transporter permease subunit Fet B [Desulfonema ishimotonii]|uniref:Iron export ABC transporter permease subunit Fet B n=1 Tax=Desulfonema ishimotonii TaxID=45657 RepID=A0A401G199_9BACT|nr:iron export ABC transporter permease subunit FetB [Desulfonema ishimotonii]GBC62990.1 iron export ABC transporter permease subunit Fet B [Desulfonema ishimotonii]